MVREGEYFAWDIKRGRTMAARRITRGIVRTLLLLFGSEWTVIHLRQEVDDYEIFVVRVVLRTKLYIYVK